jgi:hypothetical protein
MVAAPQQEQTLKKSRSITLTLMATLAAACSNGASSESGGDASFTAADTVRRCVDSTTYQVVGDEQCTGPRTGGGFYPYFFYFGGRTMLQGGQTYVSGGSRTMPSIRGPVSRGGIGARAAGRTGVGA